MKIFFTVLLVLSWFIPAIYGTAHASLILHSQTDVNVELVGFDGLAEKRIFTGELKGDSSRAIDTPYRGLALLVFSTGQSYPFIITDEDFTVRITTPAEPPVFTNSAENDYFYARLKDKGAAPEQDTFASLMLRAKQLLDSSSSIHTLEELYSKEKAFHGFVKENYQNLRHSDMIRRLISQSFMMLEYVSYHVAGTPTTNIAQKYRQEVVANVADWLVVLDPYIPKQEVLNYCVGLYYKRGMVTLASFIMENFADIAYCPGAALDTFTLPDDLRILAPGKDTAEKFADIKGSRLISFVSEQCPVSMVASVIKARGFIEKHQPVSLVVVPMEKLSSQHLAMNRMISGGNLIFVSDEKWREKTLRKKIRMPVFISLINGQHVQTGAE